MILLTQPSEFLKPSSSARKRYAQRAGMVREHDHELGLRMNVRGLVGALLPVFFVLALGYLAGKRRSFDADQAAGLSKLALGFALPASLFVGMTEIPRDLLLEQGRLVLVLMLSHVGLFLVAWILLRRVKALRGPAAVICALMLATSATPVFGIAVLHP